MREALSIDLRTVQRLRRAAVLAEGSDLDLDRLDFLDAVATEDTEDAWRRIVPWVGRAELARVRVLASRAGAEAALRRAYEGAIEEATDAAPTARRRYVSLAATLPPPPAPRHVEAHPDLPEAARWYLARGRPPRQHGIGRVKERGAYTCVNPECACRSLRVEVHHRRFRSHGGSDDDENLQTHCTPCHLRLIHSGHLVVTECGSTLVFTFADREIRMTGFLP